MKKQISCILAILMVIMVSASMMVSASGEVWVNNGNFEDGMVSWTVDSSDPNAISKYSVVDLFGRDESKALQYQIESKGAFHVYTTVNGLETGKAYTVRAWVYGTAIENNDNDGNQYFDITASADNKWGTGVGFFKNNGFDKWFEITTTFTASAEAQQIWIGFRGPIKAYLDDVTIEEETSAIFANGNGNFEKGSTDGWTCSSGNSIDATGGVDGSKALKYTLSGNNSTRNSIAAISNLETGKMYTVKVKVKIVSSSSYNKSHIGIFRNEGGTNDPRYIYMSFMPKNTWVELKHAFIATSDTTSITIKIASRDAGTETVAYLDDCTISEGGNILDLTGLTNKYTGDFTYTTAEAANFNFGIQPFSWTINSKGVKDKHVCYDTTTYVSAPASMKFCLPADEATSTQNGVYAPFSAAEFGAGKYKLSFKMKANVVNKEIGLYAYAGKTAKLSVSQTENWETKVFYIDIPAEGTKYLELYTLKAEGVDTTTEIWFDDITVEKIENESGFLNSKGEEVVNAGADETVQSYFSYVPGEGETPIYIKSVYGTEGGVRILKDVSVVPVTAPIAEIVSTTLGDACEIKMMVWDSAVGMKQIMAPKKLTVKAQ